MIKKFFVALILGLLMMSSQIVSAYDYDWSQAKRIGSKVEFASYVENGRRRGQVTFHVILANNSILPNAWKTNVIDKNDFANIIPCRDFDILFAWHDVNSIRIAFKVKEYPGTRVANAYRAGNTNGLTSEELQLYNVAIGIVNEAKKISSEVERARYIHDTICNHVKELKGENDRNKTAIGALIDGYAQCQGFTDAFYMLGTMCGFNIGKINGKADNGPHVWNTIEFGDGKYYCVDVTWDDASFKMNGSNSEYNNYIYFNAPQEIMQSTHTWEKAYAPTLQQKVDGKYFYMTKEFSDTHGKYFGFHSRSAEEALNYIARRIVDEGCRLSWAMTPYSAKYADSNFVGRRLTNEILPRYYNFYGSTRISVTRRGNYLFFTVDATKNK